MGEATLQVGRKALPFFSWKGVSGWVEGCLRLGLLIAQDHKTV